jgi:RNA polymerase sigma-70 factor (ECF subfamily)
VKDEKILRLLESDPERGMTELVSRYGGLVFSVIRGRLGPSFPEADIEDCAAETFADLWAYVPGLDKSSESLKGLVCVIAKRNALDLLRKRYREGERVPLDSENAPELPDEYSLETDIEERQLKKELTRAVNGLQEPDREIIVRKFYLCQPSKEIAKALGLSVSNVDTRTHRAVAKLRSTLKGE